MSVSSPIETITSDEMRALEQEAISSGRVTGLELMERAGHGVVEAIFNEWPELRRDGYRAVVLCGPGNNGGDGFVVARLLKELGWDVVLYLNGEVDSLPPSAKTNCTLWAEMGEIRGEASALSEVFGAEDTLVIDALFGIGLSRPIELYWREIIDKCGWFDKSLAIDIPSGFHSDTGQIIDFSESYLEETISYVDAQVIGKFDLTVTFHRQKPAHQIQPCAMHCGKIIVKDIGL